MALLETQGHLIVILDGLGLGLGLRPLSLGMLPARAVRGHLWQLRGN